MKRVISLAAIIVLILVACGEESVTVDVSGSTGIPISESGSTLTEEGMVSIFAWGDVSDDRLRGQTRALIFCEPLPDETEAADCEGTLAVVNDDGTWEGSFTGTSIQNVHNMRATLVGTGSYEGLQFRLQLNGTEYPWTITGTIEPAGS